MTGTTTPGGRPPFGISGVIEGFYGKPWMHEQRLRMIRSLGRWRLTTFMIAPKDDPWQRVHWEQAYPDGFLAQVRDLVRVADSCNVDVAVAVSPGLSVTYSDSTSVDAVLRRMRQLHDEGVNTFALLLDDIPEGLPHAADQERYPDIAAAHASFIGRLHAHMARDLPGTRLIVCPLVYRGLGTEDYIVRVGRAVADDVLVLWTGRQICSEYLHTVDARTFAEATGHPPLYWDNYPVNDVAMTYELHIGPYRGRESDLGTWCAGILLNPMPLFEASQLPLETASLYLRDPVDYDPEEAWAICTASMFEDLAELTAFRHFGLCVQDSCLNPEAMPELAPVLGAAAFAWRSARPGRACEILESVSADIARHGRCLLSDTFSRADLQDEILPWVEKYVLVGQVLGEMADVLHQCTFDAYLIGGPDQVQDLRGALSRLHANRYRMCGDGVEMMLQELIDELAWSIERSLDEDTEDAG